MLRQPLLFIKGTLIHSAHLTTKHTTSNMTLMSVNLHRQATTAQQMSRNVVSNIEEHIVILSTQRTCSYLLAINQDVKRTITAIGRVIGQDKLLRTLSLALHIVREPTAIGSVTPTHATIAA